MTLITAKPSIPPANFVNYEKLIPTQEEVAFKLEPYLKQQFAFYGG